MPANIKLAAMLNKSVSGYILAVKKFAAINYLV
jgi:hypothetical protein